MQFSCKSFQPVLKLIIIESLDILAPLPQTSKIKPFTTAEICKVTMAEEAVTGCLAHDMIQVLC
jgi:hypothetical protein